MARVTSLATASTRQLMKTLAGERHRGIYSNGCAYCGRRCFGYACHTHRDLPQLEHALYSQSNDPAPTHLADAGTGSRQKGA